jgi:murein DD-endopeptidase MepM/ murein hydrolase activator NlpD
MNKIRLISIGTTLGAFLVPVLVGCGSTGTTVRTTTPPSGWPVERSAVLVTAEFGEMRRGLRHLGIDLAAAAGTPVRATADGEVIFAGKDGRYGRTVLMDHGPGYRTRFAHLKKIETKKGDWVRRGDLIGKVGKTGNASGPHLHYEVIKNGRHVNPRSYLN